MAESDNTGLLESIRGDNRDRSGHVYVGCPRNNLSYIGVPKMSTGSGSVRLLIVITTHHIATIGSLI